MLRGAVVGFVGLLFLAALVPPQVAACTSSPGPYQGLRFQVREEGSLILDLPTSLLVGPNDLCGYTGPPRIGFDGRHAAWSLGYSLVVVDVESGEQATYPPGTFTRGHLALVEPSNLNVTLVDLADGTSRVVAAPPGQFFHRNFEGAVVAMGEGKISVLDPVGGQWLLYLADASGLSVPSAGSPDWIVFSQTQMKVVDVSSGAILSLPWSSGDSAYGVTGDRVYVRTYKSQTMSGHSYDWDYYSVHLPDGGDRQNGTQPNSPGTHRGRTAEFVTVPTPTPSTNADGPTQLPVTGMDDLDGEAVPQTGVEAQDDDGAEAAGVELSGADRVGLAALAVVASAVVLRRRIA